MSLFDYRLSIELSKNDPSFASLIMAAMRKADTLNLMKLQHGWPEIWEELKTRYWSPGGFLPEEIPNRIEREPKLAGTQADVIVTDGLDEPKKDPDEPDRKYNEDEYDR